MAVTAVFAWRKRSAERLFYSLSAMLRARGGLSAIRRVVLLPIPVLVCTDLARWLRPAGPLPGSRWLLMGLTLVLCVLWVALWGHNRWPSRGGSAAFVGIATMALAAACFSLTNPVVGLFGIMVFAIPGAYTTFFHPRFTVLVFGVAAALAVVLAWRVAHGVESVLAVCGLVIVTAVNALSWIACHIGRELLDLDMTDDDIERITGLLNREAFDRATATLLGSRTRAGDRFLVLLVIGIDDFGLLVGAEGIAAGDHVRMSTADVLGRTTRRGAVVAHVNTDQFLLAEVFGTANPGPLTERIRSAIAATPPGLTASIGAAVLAMDDVAEVPPDLLIDHLIDSATVAMLDGQRAGGDRTRRVHCDAPAEDDDIGAGL
jgi:GGDEF domain-containing protein